MGVSRQAVSKWENEQSYPDIGFLPQIAAYFHVTTDYLLTGKESPEAAPAAGLPDDGVLRILQFRGSQLLTKNLYDPQIRIMLEIRKEDYEGNHCPTIPVEVWGSADIKGCISGGVRAGDGVNCGNVSGGVKAGDGVNCANVSGGVNAGDGVNCANVSGGVSAGDGDLRSGVRRPSFRRLDPLRRHPRRYPVLCRHHPLPPSQGQGAL